GARRRVRDGLVLVGAGTDEAARLPGGAVVVAVDAEGVVASVVPDGVLLDEPARVPSVAQLDALAGRREHAAPGRVLDLGGDPLVLPGQAVVVGVAVVGLLDVRIVLVVAGRGAEVAMVHGRGVEGVDAPGLPVDEEAGVAVALGGGLLAHHLLGLPGGAAVGAAPDHHADVAGQVAEGGAGVVGRDERAPGGPGEGGDAVVRGAGARGGDVLRGEGAGSGGGLPDGRVRGGGAGGQEGQRRARGDGGQGDSALHERASSRVGGRRVAGRAGGRRLRR